MTGTASGDSDASFASEIFGRTIEMSRRQITPHPSSREMARSPYGRSEPMLSDDSDATVDDQTALHFDSDSAPRQHAGSILRYSLLAINLMFCVAALMLIMSGLVLRINNAVSLCHDCLQLTLAPVVVGICLWLLSAGGFLWIKQRNICFLLAYATFLVALVLILLSVVIAAGAFLSANTSSSTMLSTWEDFVRKDPQQLCALQARYNCSGYHYGCCRGPERYTNGTNLVQLPRSDDLANVTCYSNDSFSPPPDWVAKVCPVCGPPGDYYTAPDSPSARLPSTIVCSEVVYRTLHRNLIGFMVINSLALCLIVVGLLLALGIRSNSRSARSY